MQDLIDKCGHDAEDTTMRRPTSLILEKLADPTLVKKHPYQEHIIQAANNIIEDTGRFILNYCINYLVMEN